MTKSVNLVSQVRSDFPATRSMSPFKQFPFKHDITPNRHSEHTIILSLPAKSTVQRFSLTQPSVIHLFCKCSFTSRYSTCPSTVVEYVGYPIPVHSLKVGYTAHDFYRNAGSSLRECFHTRLSLRENWDDFCMPLQLAQKS